VDGRVTNGRFLSDLTYCVTTKEFKSISLRCGHGRSQYFRIILYAPGKATSLKQLAELKQRGDPYPSSEICYCSSSLRHARPREEPPRRTIWQWDMRPKRYFILLENVSNDSEYSLILERTSLYIQLYDTMMMRSMTITNFCKEFYKFNVQRSTRASSSYRYRPKPEMSR
jgi:hypothetical protein